MKIDPDDTPDSYRSIEVVASYEFDNENRSIDVNCTTTHDGDTIFHVVMQPPMEEIESHNDIVTLTSFKPSQYETVGDAFKQAKNSALEYYGDMNQ